MTVADATPLIALARIGAFSLLRQLFGSLLIPPGVFDDVVTRGRNRPGAAEVEAGMRVGWILVESPCSLLLPPHSGMHRGEVEALSLAAARHLGILMDEGPGRRRTVAEGIPLVGTLDVVRLARATGLIDAVRPLLDALRREGFHMDDELYARVLDRAGEPAGPC